MLCTAAVFDKAALLDTAIQPARLSFKSQRAMELASPPASNPASQPATYKHPASQLVNISASKLLQQPATHSVDKRIFQPATQLASELASKPANEINKLNDAFQIRESIRTTASLDLNVSGNLRKLRKIDVSELGFKVLEDYRIFPLVGKNTAPAIISHL